MADEEGRAVRKISELRLATDPHNPDDDLGGSQGDEPLRRTGNLTVGELRHLAGFRPPAVCRATEGAHVPAAPNMHVSWCLNCGLGIKPKFIPGGAASVWEHVVLEESPFLMR